MRTRAPRASLAYPLRLLCRRTALPPTTYWLCLPPTARLPPPPNVEAREAFAFFAPLLVLSTARQRHTCLERGQSVIFARSCRQGHSSPGLKRGGFFCPTGERLARRLRGYVLCVRPCPREPIFWIGAVEQRAGRPDRN